MIDFTPIWLSLKLALLTSVILLVIGVPIAFALSQIKSKVKIFLESFITLPIVLPPTIIGFYLLLVFSDQTMVGRFLNDAGIKLPFTFAGILIASLVYSFPFMVQPVQKAFENTPKRYWDISYTLGKSKMQTLWYVILPNIKFALITGFVLTFAHTMGEFGVILMIGGKIPGVTEVASIYIYNHFESPDSIDRTAAHVYSLILIGISMTIIVSVNYINRRLQHRDNGIH